VVAAALLVASTTARALELGDKAPEFDSLAWAKGDAITIASGAGKSVFVVEFFSVFQKESAAAFDAAAKLQDKWKTKGLEVVAVTVENKSDVDKFVGEHPTNARVAIDELHNTQTVFVGTDPGLPTALVVDKSGAIVFTGDPTDGMDKLVDDVINGKFDLKKAVAIRDLKKQLGEDPDEDAGDLPPGDKKEAAKKRNERAVEIYDKILELDPTDEFAYERRCDAYRRKDDLDAYRKFVKSYLDRVKDDAKSLARVARDAMNENKMNWRDPDTAVTAGRRAVEITKAADAEILDAYANLLSSLGLLELAVDYEKKAVAAEPKAEQYAKSLAFYQSCLAVKQKVQPTKK